MDQIAIISDIHGNMPALEAVLDNIEKRRIAKIYCLGDLVGKGPCPAEAVDVIRNRCEVIVRGNWDELMSSAADDEEFTWHSKRLGQERIDYLSGLPFSFDFLLSGKLVRLFHASPQSVFHRVHPWEDEAKRLALFENTPAVQSAGKEAGEPDIVGYGDIHNAYMQHLYGKTLFNAGSVGNPLDILHASYAILEGEYGGLDPAGFSIQFVRVPYDVERAVRQAEEARVPKLEAYIRELRTGIYRGLQT